MQPGSLVTPTVDFEPYVMNGTLGINGIIPKPNEIFVCEDVFELNGSTCLKVEESHLEWIETRGTKYHGDYTAKYWRELQAPEEVNAEEIVEESCCVTA
jgi:hypothetical protein